MVFQSTAVQFPYRVLIISVYGRYKIVECRIAFYGYAFLLLSKNLSTPKTGRPTSLGFSYYFKPIATPTLMPVGFT